MSKQITYAVERYNSTSKQWGAYSGGIKTLTDAKKEAKGLSSTYAKKHRVVKEQVICIYNEKGKLDS